MFCNLAHGTDAFIGVLHVYYGLSTSLQLYSASKELSDSGKGSFRHAGERNVKGTTLELELFFGDGRQRSISCSKFVSKDSET